MEFKSLKNIETSFKQIRVFALAFLGLCTVITVLAVWKSFSYAEAQRQKIYILDNGKSLMLALSQDLSQNRSAEAKEHVRRFHELFFTLSPDKEAIESNARRAFNLADRSAINYFRDLQEKGYYKPFARIREKLTGTKEQITGKVREGTSRLSPRQRVVVIAVLFITFVVVDVVFIVQGFRGESKDKYEMQHLKQVEIKPLIPIQNDTIPEYDPGK